MPGPVSEWVRLPVKRILADTAKAFLLQLGKDSELWVPKGCVADHQRLARGDVDCTVSVAAWWWKAKGMSDAA
jgi:hypothetical protein